VGGDCRVEPDARQLKLIAELVNLARDLNQRGVNSRDCTHQDAIYLALGTLKRGPAGGGREHARVTGHRVSSEFPDTLLKARAHTEMLALRCGASTPRRRTLQTFQTRSY